MPTRSPDPTRGEAASAAAHPPRPRSPRSRGAGRARRPVVLLAVLLAVLALVGTGCVRVRAGLAISPDDTVSGVIDIGTPDGTPAGTGPPLQVPSELSGDVSVERYEQDGYIGSRVRFEDLSFDDVSRVLPAISPTTTSAIRLQLRRGGDRVVLSGQVDLTRVSPEGADVRLKIAFPGRVRQTDGTLSRGVVSWTFQPGAVGDVNAVAEYPNPNAPPWVLWVVVLTLVVLAAAGIVAFMAASTRPPPVTRARR